jgi:hypothetical protein
MSVNWILNSDYSTIKNSKLSQNLEVTGSLKAPIHYVSDIPLSKTQEGALLFDCPVIEATVVQTDSVNAISGVFTSAIAPLITDPSNTVLMNGDLDFSSVSGIKNLVSLTLANGAGTANQVLSLDADLNLVFKDDTAGDISQWSTYNAISTVNLGSNYLDGAKTVTDDVWTNYISLPKDGSSSSMYLNSFNNTAKIPNLLVDSLNKSDPLETQINCNTNLNLAQNTLYAGTGNFSSVITNSAQIISLVIPGDTPAAGDVLKIDANENIYWSSDLNVPSAWSEYPATQSVDMNVQSLDNVLNVTMQGQLNVNQINPNVGFDTLSLTGDLNMVGKRLDADSAYFTGAVSVGQLIPTYIQSNTLWVSSNGSDTNNGSFESPVKTIQRALYFAEAVADNQYWYINVLPGTYAGFTVTKKCFIKGMSPSTPDGCSVGCQINSDITISINANGNDMFNNQVSLSGFLIAGAEILCNSGNTANSVLNISDCYLYNDSGSGRLIHYNPDSTDGRLWLFNTRLVNQSTSATNAAIEISKGMLKMGQCICSVSGLTNVLKMNGSSRIDSVVQCSFTSTNASAVLPPIVELSTSGSVFTFSQSAFIYTSSTNKSANPNSCAILCASATSQPTVILSFNSFFLAGTSQQSNYVLQDSNNGTIRQAIVLFFSNNSSLNNAFAIRGTAGVSKFSLNPVA